MSSAPARSTCQRGRSVSTSLLCANVPINLPKTCQFFNLAFQHAKRGSNISTSPAKTRTNYSTIFQKKLYFSIMLNTCKYQKYLGNSGKFIARNKEFKFWSLHNFNDEKPYQPKTFDVVFIGARKINRTIIPLV